MRIRIVPASEVRNGSPLRPHIMNSLYAPDYVGNPEGIKKDIAQVELQKRRLDGRLHNLNEELVRHEACSPDGVE